MAKHITTSIQINSDLETVWQVLTDFKSYPEWNPFIKSIEGEPIVGQKIEAKLAGMTFKPEVLIFEEKKVFKWLGHLLIKGLFDGEHGFLLTKNDDGVHFEQSEKFSGILVPLFAKSLDSDTVKGFNEMNERLKVRCENLFKVAKRG
ncbi:MAG: SRPBCC domain-containing protein [Cryomorphaceae bacterium]